MKDFYRYIIALTVLMILFSCAQRGRPDGGPEDVDPPEFVGSKPANYSVRYNKNEIKINFDEFVKLENPRQQIIFSPPIEPRPNIMPMSMASKSFTIDLPSDSLQTETTYTINFGMSVQDNNEGNTLPYFKYVFSTGDHLDSLKVDGHVRDAFEREPDENISVLLYRVDSTFADSTVYKTLPTYIAYTDSVSNFSVENVKEGRYKVIALSDKNNNYLFNPKSDKIDFLEKEIDLPTDEEFELSVFKTELDFKSDRPKQISQMHFEFGYEGKLDSAQINVISEVPADFDYRVYNDIEKDTLHYWYKPYTEKDSLLFEVRNQGYRDTLEIRPKEIEIDSLQLTAQPKGGIGFFEDFTLRANTPIEKIDTTKFAMLTADSIPIDLKIDLDRKFNRVGVQFEKTEKERYALQILPEAITDFYGETNDTLIYKFATKSYSDFGNIDLTIHNIEQYPVIVEMVTDKGKVEQSLYQEQGNLFEFKYINPGKYYFRIIYDENRNGKWDTGKYLDNRKPEKVIYVKKMLKVRAFFDYVETINL
ncbi:MAG: Ig-like domain-containing protein [Psychroflexus sp.]|nr:Ig-like domain-containing protein [Psychroflexus sp.]MDN6310592.1 Ig-like domain-containing protein [Psychroflexus sp.]